MSFDKIWSRILVFLIILSVLTAGYIAGHNDLATRTHSQVELAVDLDEITALSEKTGLSISVVLESIVEAGVNSVGMNPVSIDDLQEEGRLSIFTSEDVLRAFQLTGKLPVFLEGITDNQQLATGEPPFIYIVTREVLLAEKITERLSYREGDFSSHYHGGMALHVFKTTDSLDDLLSLRLFLLPLEAEIIKEKGLQVVPRISNCDLTSPELLQGYMHIFRDFEVSTFLPAGSEVLGYANFLAQTAHMLNDLDWALGAVEYAAQPVGLGLLSAYMENNLVSVHPIFFGQATCFIVNRVAERRARLLYMRFFREHDSPETVPEVLGFLQRLTAGLERAGFVIGPAAKLSPPSQPVYLWGLMIAGSLAGSFLLLLKFSKAYIAGQVAVYLLSLLLLLFLFYFNFTLGQLILALLITFIFPALAVIAFQLERAEILRGRTLSPKARLLEMTLALIKTVVFALAGGILVNGLLGTPAFFFGVNILRGVKMAYVVPLILVGVFLLHRYLVSGNQKVTLASLYCEGKELFYRPVRYGPAALLVAALVAGIIYLGRTGHTAGIPVLELEIILRQFLDEVMVARPRLKEFLIAYPLAVLGLYHLFGGKRGQVIYLLIVFGTIAQISIVNSFAHSIVSLSTSLLRTVNGLFLGYVIGLLLIVATGFLARQLAGISTEKVRGER